MLTNPVDTPKTLKSLYPIKFLDTHTKEIQCAASYMLGDQHQHPLHHIMLILGII
jgi:hypothetical protein